MPCKDSWRVTLALRLRARSPDAQVAKRAMPYIAPPGVASMVAKHWATWLRGLRGQRGLRGYTRKTFFNLFHAFFVDGFTLTSGTSSFAAPEEDDTSDLCYNMLRHVTIQQYSNLWFMTSRRQRPTYVRWFQFAPKLSGPKTSSMPGYSLITSRLITHLVEERQWLWGSCRNRK